MDILAGRGVAGYSDSGMTSRNTTSETQRHTGGKQCTLCSQDPAEVAPFRISHRTGNSKQEGRILRLMMGLRNCTSN